MWYFGSIEYDGQNQNSYTHIILTQQDIKFEQIFSNKLKCPVIDYINVIKFLSEKNSGCRWSSSFDHFLMDGDLYLQKYVKITDSDNPDSWVFVENIDSILNEEYDFSVISKPEFTSFQDLRTYIRTKNY